MSVSYWCGRGDLNPHGLVSHKLLRLARLPVPPLPQGRGFLPDRNNKYTQNQLLAVMPPDISHPLR